MYNEWMPERLLLPVSLIHVEPSIHDSYYNISMEPGRWVAKCRSAYYLHKISLPDSNNDRYILCRYTIDFKLQFNEVYTCILAVAVRNNPKLVVQLWLGESHIDEKQKYEWPQRNNFHQYAGYGIIGSQKHKIFIYILFFLTWQKKGVLYFPLAAWTIPTYNLVIHFPI